MRYHFWKWADWVAHAVPMPDRLCEWICDHWDYANGMPR